jgi:hypothetical protein
MKPDFDRRHRLLDDDQLSHALRRLPVRTSPAGLTTSLRVMASRERELALRRGVLETFSAWAVRTRLWIDNLMRPLAVPFAGGVLSALALFGIWLVPTYPLRASASTLDVSTVLTTEAMVKHAGLFGVSSSDVTVDVDVFVDDQGHMTSYKVVSGTGVLTDATLRRNLENMLLFTDFVPATSFGTPTAGRLRLSVVSSSIIVKG